MPGEPSVPTMNRARWISGPRQSRGYWFWQARQGPVEIRFVGRGPEADSQEVLRAITHSSPRLAWLRQVHSAQVVVARIGLSGEADALVTDRPNLALAISSADCVPILLAGENRVAAIHAGWRGLIAGIVAETVRRMSGDPSRIAVWIGPAIGACCYEVSSALARRIAAQSHASVIADGLRDRPHVDLPGTAACQLSAAGVTDIRHLIRCTRCDANHLWSYRREGRKSGRNHAFIWTRTPWIRPA